MFTEQFKTATPDNPVFPNVEVQLAGQDGNAFAILGSVQAALRRAGVSADDISAFHAEATSGDYENLLRVTASTVDVS